MVFFILFYFLISEYHVHPSSQSVNQLLKAEKIVRKPRSDGGYIHSRAPHMPAEWPITTFGLVLLLCWCCCCVVVV